MDSKNVSQAVIRRLPRYYRYLSKLKDEGIERISSGELSKLMRITASQVRQDLNCFGGFGQQGYGYTVDELYDQIAKILGVDKQCSAIVIGAGDLGRSIARYRNFEKYGFVIREVFDINKDLINTPIAGFLVKSMDKLEDYLKHNSVDIAILTVPRDVTREIAERVTSLGVKGLWNFSPMGVLVDDENVVVENVHLSDSLMVLGYKFRSRDNKIN